MLQMKEVTVGAIGTCCYILWDDARTDCVVIDPGDEPEHIRKAADGRTIAAILLTHGHFDHIGAVRALMTPETELVIHVQDAPMLSNPQENASFLMGAPVTAPEATKLVHEGDTVTAAGLTFTVLHTPGHTAGSVCYQIGEKLFTGDALPLRLRANRFAHGEQRADASVAGTGGADGAQSGNLPRTWRLK